MISPVRARRRLRTRSLKTRPLVLRTRTSPKKHRLTVKWLNSKSSFKERAARM